jgi:hypothetical protein
VSVFTAGLILMRVEKFERASELTSSDRLVLATLFSFAAEAEGKEPLAYPSVPKVASRAGTSRSTVQRSLGHLEKVGAITGEHRYHKPTVWSLTAPFRKQQGPTVTPPSPTLSRSVQVRSGPPVTSASPTVTLVRPHSDSGMPHLVASSSPTATDQCTDGDGPKVRHRTDSLSGSASSDGSAPHAADSSAPPPPAPRFHVPPVAVPRLTSSVDDWEDAKS